MTIALKENPRVLVTGGAGFIGSALVWALNARGIERIVIADRLGATDKWRNLAPLRFEDYVEAEDLLERLGFNDLGEFDLALHMGACSSTLERNASYLIRNNYEVTRDLATWALSSGVRFVYASSAATYGDGTQGMSDEVQGTADLSKLRPLNAYGYSKQLFDQYALSHGMLDSIVGVKFFNVFGPNEGHKGEMRSLVHKAFEQVRDTDRLKLFKSYRGHIADGEQQRDFVYVKDAVAMTLHLAFEPDAAGLYNIGSGKAHTWIDLANAVFAAMKLPPSIEFIDMPEPMRERYQYFTKAEIGRLRSAGFNEEPTPLADAIAEYVREYLQHDRRLGDER